LHRTMHILNVTSSVSRCAKCTKIVGGWGFAPDTTGELTALPVGLKGSTSKAPTSKGGEKMEGEGRGEEG